MYNTLSVENNILDFVYIFFPGIIFVYLANLWELPFLSKVNWLLFDLPRVGNSTYLYNRCVSVLHKKIFVHKKI